jgi:hypothetical protein
LIVFDATAGYSYQNGLYNYVTGNTNDANLQPASEGGFLELLIDFDSKCWFL